MTSNDSIINVKTKKIQCEQNDKNAFNTLRIDIIIYPTYPLLYCKEHIQMTSNDSIINVKTKKYRVNKMTKLHLIHLDLTLQYVTLTNYYIAKDTFR